jgi:hypothetical protein
LESVTIGSRVNQIGSYAFDGCISLEEIINKAARPQAINTAMVFYRLDVSFITLEVPANAVNAYKTSDGWKGFQFNQ